MNLKNLFSKLGALIVVAFLFVGVTTAQTFYVNNQTGDDAYPGTQAQPKKTVGSALIAAPPNATISVAATGVAYTEGNITVNKALTFTSTGGGTPVFNNAGLIVQVNTTFTGAFQFTDLTLTAGAVTGASNLTFSGNVTRTAGSVDSQINFTAGLHNFTYNGGAAINSGFELPPTANTTNFGNLTTVGGGTVLTLNESKTMNGVLTTADALNLGGNTLTIVGASAAHAVAGNVTNGTLAFSLTGNAQLAGNFTLPAVTASGTAAAGGQYALTLTTNAAIGSLTASGDAGITANNTTTIGAGGSTANNIVNSGNGTIQLNAVTTVNGNVLLSSSGIDGLDAVAAGQAEGFINFGAGVTVNGNVTNSAGLTVANTAALNANNSGIISFPNAAHTITGNVVNNVVVSGTVGAATNATNSGRINFANVATNVTINGAIQVGSRTDISSSTASVAFNGLGLVTFGNNPTTAVIRVDGGITNSSDFSLYTAAQNVNNGQVILGGAARANGSTIGTAANRVGPIVNSSKGPLAGDGNGDIIVGVGGAVTNPSGFWGTSITNTGATGGYTLLQGKENVNISGNVSNSRTTNNTSIVIGPAAGLAAATLTIGGNVENSGANTTSLALTIDGALNVTGSLTNSAGGTITVTNHTTGAVGVGGLVSSGATGTITFPAITNGVITTGSINVSAGTLNVPATHNAAVNVNGPWTVSGGNCLLKANGADPINVSQTVSGATINWTNGIIDFQGRNTVGIGSIHTYLGGATTNPTFTNAATTTLNFIEPLPNLTQNIHVGLADFVYPGPVTITNAANIPAPVVSIVPEGGALANLYILNNVTFNTGTVLNSVDLNGVRFNVGKNGLGGGNGDFQNTTGYTTQNGGRVMMSGTNAVQTVNGAGVTAGALMSDFGVDNERVGANDVVFGNATTLVGDFYLAEGDVNPANLTFQGAAPNYLTIYRTEGTFSANIGGNIAVGTRVNVTYYGSDKATSNEIPNTATGLHNLTIATTNGATAGKGIVSVGAAFTVNGTTTINTDQTLFLNDFVVTCNGDLGINGNVINKNGGAADLIAFGGTSNISGGGSLCSFQVNDGATVTMSSPANLVDAAFGADNNWGGGDDDFTTSDGSITHQTGGAGTASSLTLNFPALAGAITSHFLNLTTTADGNETVTLASNITMGGNLTHASGSIDLGGFTLDHRGTAPNLTVGATITNGLLYFQSAATNLTVNGPGTAVIGANFQYQDVNNNATVQTFTFLSASTGDLRIEGDITLSNTAGAGDGVNFDIGAGRTLTAGGANVSVASLCAFTAVNGGATGILLLDNQTAAPNNMLTYSTPSNTNVTNLTIADDVTLSSGGTLTVVTAFNHTAGDLQLGATNLQIGNAGAATFNRSGATTYGGTGILIWNSTTAAGFQHSSLVAAGTMTINNFRLDQDLTLQNARNLVVVNNLNLNAGSLTNQVGGAGAGYVHVGDATTVPMITVNNNEDVLVNALQFDNTNADYTYTGGAGTASARIWPTAPSTVPRHVVINKTATNTETLLDNKSINGNLTLTQGTLGWDSPVDLSIASGSTITVNKSNDPALGPGGATAGTDYGNLNLDLSGAGAVGTFTAPSVNLVYTDNSAANGVRDQIVTGIEYSLPTSVNDFTLGLPAGTFVQIASARTIDGTVTFNSTLNINANTTFALALTLPNASTINVAGATTATFNNGLVVNGAYNNTGGATSVTTVVAGGLNVGTAGVLSNQGTVNVVGGLAITAGGAINDNAATTGIWNLDGLTAASAGVANAVAFPTGGTTVNLTGDATIGNVAWATQANASANGPVVINTANNITLNGVTTNTHVDFNFTGTLAQTVALGANRTINNLTLNKGNDQTVTFSGGNLTLNAAVVGPPATAAGVLTLTRGVLVMTGVTGGIPHRLTLQLTVTGGIITNLGYVRNPANNSDLAHVVGPLGVFIPAGTIGRSEWPVGSATEYRPAALTFTGGNATIAPTTIVVEHVDGEPAGDVNLPLDGGTKFNNPAQTLMIGSKGPYSWKIMATTSLGASQLFDLELQGTNLNRPFETVNDLRIIRRFDGDVNVNGWFLQGNAANYSNILVEGVPNPTDTIVVVRNQSSQGGIVQQAAFFTVGVPTQPPVWDAVPPDAAVNEGATYTFDYDAHDPDVGASALTYSIMSVTPALPAADSASINATTGEFTFTPGYDFGQAAYTFVVKVEKDNDASSFETDAVVLTVNNVNRAPAFTQAAGDSDIVVLEPFAFDFNAADPDPNDALTYSIQAGQSGDMTITPGTGVFLWTPTIAELQAGPAYPVTVRVTDNDAESGGANPLTADTTFTLTITYGRHLGDANGSLTNGLFGDGVTSEDASEVLKFSVGNPNVITDGTDDAIDAWAADATQNGTITPFDAYYILYYSVNGSFPNAAPKVIAGDVGFGQLKPDAKEESVVSIPVVISNGGSIQSALISIEIDEQYAEFLNVSTTQQEGWFSLNSYKDGKLKIALTGMDALQNGQLAVINLRIKDKEAKFDLKGLVSLNDQLEKDIEASVRQVPATFDLSQNYPNPFNPTTKMKYQLPLDSKVSITIYDIMGQKVKTLVNGIQEAGYYTVEWDGTNNFGTQVTSGIYIYRLEAGSFNKTMKMNFIK